MAETIILYIVTLMPPVLYLAVALFGRKSKHLKTFRESMLKNYRPALIISLIFYLGPFIGTLNPQKLWNIPAAADIFCISSFGLAMAKSIAGCEPLPVTDSIIKRDKVLKNIILTAVFALIIVILGGVISSYGFNICLSVFHESDKKAQAMQMLPYKNKWLSFFTLLAGAGIAEEATYRLFFLTLFWKLLKNPWFALVLSSLCFSLYHLTPLDTMYQVYWQFPIAQVVGVFLSSLIFGFFYIKRGFETCVLGHTLLDWTSVIF